MPNKDRDEGKTKTAGSYIIAAKLLMKEQKAKDIEKTRKKKQVTLSQAKHGNRVST